MMRVSERRTEETLSVKKDVKESVMDGCVIDFEAG